MSRPYVCSACRSSRLVSSHFNLPRQSRQFSSSIRKQNEPGFESPYAEWGTRSQSEYSSEEYTEKVFGEQRIRSNPEPRSGRYSGQPLRPAHLLDELKQAPPHRAPAAEPQTYDRHQQSESPRVGLFEEEVAQSELQQRVREQTDSFADSVRRKRWLEAYGCLKEIKKLLKDQEPSHFRHRLSPRIHADFRQHSVNDWATIFRGTQTEQDKSPVPGPLQVKQLLTDIGWNHAASWSGLLWQVSEVVTQYRARTKADDDPRLLMGIRELVGLWQLCLNHRKEFINGDRFDEYVARDAPWSFLPPPEALKDMLRDIHGEDPLNQMLWTAFPGPNPTRDGKTTRPADGNMRLFDYASPALLTIDLLRAPLGSAEDGVESSRIPSQETQPLLDFLKEALRLAGPVTAPTRLRNRLNSIGADTIYFLQIAQRSKVAVDPERVARIQEANDQRQSSEDGREDARIYGVSADDSVEPTSANEVVFDVRQTPEMQSFAQSCIFRLVRARQQNNFHLAQMIKYEVMEMAEKNASAGKPPPPLELYEHLMLIFLLLAHPKTAMEVWESMIQAGLSPTVRTYTNMVRGARASRDSSGMQAFWERMRNAGIQPDLPAWTAYIHGQIKLGRIDQGLEAVKSMGREWLAAAQEQAALDQRAAGGSSASSRPPSNASLLATYPASVRGVPRPDVSILNCAVTALVDARERAVPEVVSWARAFGIEPDITSYNTLLNLAMRASQTKNATALLARMQERGIAPNGDTWVVLLAAMFQNGFLNGVDRDKQLDKVLAWVDSTKDADGRTTVDGKGFALIIDRFVKQLKNSDAATGVLSYMAKNDIRFSVHMATIVLTSYFEEDPPNFNAIDALWQRMTSGDLNGSGSARIRQNVASLDTVFYDRMIEGLARYHYLVGLRPCLDNLARCQREGRKPGWRALEQVARAMAGTDRLDLLRDLVIGIRARLRQGRGGTQLQGQHDFWKFVISTGILAHEGIRRPEHLLPRNGPRPSPMLEGLSGGEEGIRRPEDLLPRDGPRPSPMLDGPSSGGEEGLY